MKFSSTTTVIAAIAALSSVQALTFTSPTTGSVWTVGQKVSLTWTGDCTVLGGLAKDSAVGLYPVKTDDTPSFTINYLTSIDCSSPSGGSATANIDGFSFIKDNEYYFLAFGTKKEITSNTFLIRTSTSPATPNNTAAPTKSGADKSLVVGSLLALAGVATSILQYAL